MSNFLIDHYKGTYRLLSAIDQRTNDFPRNKNGSIADNDVYIKCRNNCMIYYYGKNQLEFYCPSLQRGHNILKKMYGDHIGSWQDMEMSNDNIVQGLINNDIITNFEENDSEVFIRFHSKMLPEFETYFVPSTNGSMRSPFSTKNLPKTKYTISDDKMSAYKEILSNLPKNDVLKVNVYTNNFIKKIFKNKKLLEEAKADMKLKGLKGKEYIDSIGKWDEYIKFLRKEIEKNDR